MKKEEISKRIEEIENELKQLRNKLQDEDKYFDLYKLTGSQILFDEKNSMNAGFDSHLFMQVRGLNSEYQGKAFFLSPVYDWVLKKDSKGYLCLIPTKK